MTAPLAGRLLVASPAMGDPNFDRTVVLVLEHSEDGALGVILNRPTELDLSEALPQWAPLAPPPTVVFAGGPVEPEAVLCLAEVGFPTKDDVWTPVASRLGVLDVSRHPDDVGQRARQVRVFAGCAGWGPDQLESEMAAGAWFVVDGRPDDAFSVQPLGLWPSVLRRQGGRMAVMSAFPADPSLN